ncbi:ABC transporter permease [Zhengella mangrovi]|uniref:ABC transporter permease n=1 Tax=Zhengella mangrovi TaxID=1982044 RepID=A0A2G1QT29_9HYPH|nr:ABC transporter permease subunit [Zhengella mangrovi]PHP68696.1 ABC transporter permease [Zhengella mangrovi]
MTGFPVARLGPPLAIALLAGPVVAGLAGTLVPAFGYLPALGGDRFSLEPFRHLSAQPGLVQSCLVSLFAGLAATVVSLAGVALFVAAHAGTPLFGRLQHLLSPLLSVPHAAAAFGLAFLVAPSGWLARIVSPGLTGWTAPPDVLLVHDAMGLAMIAGLVAKEIPFLLLIALAALPQVRLAETRRLAASLGHGRIAGFLFFAWPPLYRQLRLAVLAVLAFSTSVVDVAVILGPVAPAPLAVRLVGWMNDPDLAMRFFASAGAILQLGITALACLLWLALERVGGGLLAWLRDGGWRGRRDRALRAAALVLPGLSALTIGAGLVLLAIWSVAGLWQFPDALPQAFTMRSWQRALPQLAGPLTVTFTVGILAAAIATVLAILCLRREDETMAPPGRLLWLVYLPLIVPQAAFLFGLQLLLIGIRAEPGLSALVLAHLVFVMPYVFLSLSDPWRAYDRRYETIAAGLGASRLRTFWRIRMPMMARAVLAAAAVGFAVSVGQYLPTLLVGAGRLTTITTEAVALASGGNRRVIGVYAFLQMLLPVIGFAIASLVPALLWRRRLS